MLPTAPLNLADLTTQRLQVPDSYTNLVPSTTPEATFASLLVPLPEPDVALVPPVIGEALPVDGEALPDPTEFLPNLEDGAEPIVPATTVDADIGRDVPVLPVTAADTDEPSVTAITPMDPRPLPDVRTDRVTRAAVESVVERADIPNRIPRQPVDPAAIRPDIIGRDVVTDGGDAGTLPLPPFPRGRDMPVHDVEAPTTHRRQEADLQPLRGGLERLPIDVTREPALMPDAAVGRDVADTSGKPAIAPSGSVFAGTAEAALLREAGVPPKGVQTVVTTIDRPVLDEAWGDSLQERVLWMTSRKLQSAEIRLNPAELGPIRVQVSVQDDAAVLNFTAQHSLTREAIEQAMPRLREMLSENGLTLAGTTVSDAREEGADADQRASAGNEPADTDGPLADEPEAVRTEIRRTDVSGLVDTFV